jgi:hypothetical protein
VRLLLWMQPRSHAAALRSIAMLASVAVLVTIAFLPVQPGGWDLTATEGVLLLGLVALVVIGCWAARSRPIPALIAWANSRPSWSRDLSALRRSTP